MVDFGGNEALGILIFLLFLAALISIVVMSFQLAGLKRVLTHSGNPLGRLCPYCRERINREASVCKHCGRESPAWRFEGGRWQADGPDGDLWFDETTNTWHPVNPR